MTSNRLPLKTSIDNTSMTNIEQKLFILRKKIMKKWNQF